MAVKVVKRNSSTYEVAFRCLAVGEMFAYAETPSDLHIKSGHDSSINITNGQTSLVANGVPCLKVDVNIEWCVVGSI